MTDRELLAQLQALETEIDYSSGPPAGFPPFRHEPGHLPILLSAPHGTAHWREGKLKEEDEYTSGFARLLARRTGAHVLYTTHRQTRDPNWDRHSPYCNVLGELANRHGIRFVIDIHGMSDRHGIGVALGSMGDRSCPRLQPLLVDRLVSHGFELKRPAVRRAPRSRHWRQLAINHPRFTGGLRNHTVTRHVVDELELPAVQFELCSSLRIVERKLNHHKRRPFRGEPAGIATAIRAFCDMVRESAAAL